MRASTIGWTKSVIQCFQHYRDQRKSYHRPNTIELCFQSFCITGSGGVPLFGRFLCRLLLQGFKIIWLLAILNKKLLSIAES